MTRHIIDRAAPKAEGARVKHFLDLARKVQEFLRIDREERAGA